MTACASHPNCPLVPARNCPRALPVTACAPRPPVTARPPRRPQISSLGFQLAPLPHLALHSLAVAVIMAHTRTVCLVPYFQDARVRAALRRWAGRAPAGGITLLEQTCKIMNAPLPRKVPKTGASGGRASSAAPGLAAHCCRGRRSRSRGAQHGVASPALILSQPSLSAPGPPPARAPAQAGGAAGARARGQPLAAAAL